MWRRGLMGVKQLLLLMFRILLCFLLFCCIPTQSQGHSLAGNQTNNSLGDSLPEGQSLTGNQILNSFGRTFELGYFSLGNPKRYYIGIWYREVTSESVVWVANREKPLLNTTAEFKISDDGNLVIQTPSKSLVWSTNLSISSRSPSSRIAVLLNNGNLILRDQNSSNSVVWESFSHPTHCFLPGGKLGINKVTNQTQSLTSWKNAEDPSPGRYTNEIDPVRFNQTILVWRMTQQYWTTGPWNRQQYFENVPELKNNQIFNYSFVMNESMSYLTYTLYDSSNLVRYKMDIDGKLKQMVWKRSSKKWLEFWNVPSQMCEVYAQCGAFGVCYYNDTQNNPCECIDGFTPSSMQEWGLRDWSSGCIRQAKVQCGDNKFFLISGVNPPANPVNSIQGNAKECRLACVNNCSCTAYSYQGNSCHVWSGDLLNLQQFSNSSGQSIYIRLAGTEEGTKHSRAGVFITVAVASIVCVVVGACCLWRYKTKAAGRRTARQTYEAILGGEIKDSRGHELSLLELQVIMAATNNFSESNKLGQGGFGPVYKGVLGGDQEVAMKRLSKASKQGLEEFMNEVRLIAKLQHRNLVQLLGCCIEGEEKILVYEYMPNKSLDKFLFDPTLSDQLNWEKRLDILIGVARGLQYLHEDSRLRVVHRDLKTSNILLDSAMNPKISDFGLARMFGGADPTGGDHTHINTNRVVGTYGYISPECVMEGRYSTKSDVFSFGVIVLEIVSGKRMTSFRNVEYSLNLLGHAWKLWQEDKAMDLLDPILGKSCNIAQVTRCINIGLLCVQEDAADRPTMSSIVAMLGSNSSTMIEPKQPAYSHKGRPSIDSSIENESQSQIYTGNAAVSLSAAR